jgi:3-dehydroquinate dehydratase
MMGWNEEKPLVIQPQLFNNFSEDEENLISVIRELKEPHIDEIVANNSAFTVSKIASILLSLELNEVIESLPGKRYRIIKK